MNRKAAFLFIFLNISFVMGLAQSVKDFTTLRTVFITKVQQYNTSLQLDFKQNVRSILSHNNKDEQIIFFESTKKALNRIKVNELRDSLYLDYQLMKYETAMNLHRLQLNTQFSETELQKVSTLYQLPGGKGWYEYFLKRWVDISVTPMEIYNLGMEQTARAKQNIDRLRKERGLAEEAFLKLLQSDSFYLKDTNAIEASFEAVKATVQKNLGNIFYAYTIPDVGITKGTNEALKQTPGYYSNNTFFYNYFDEPYNKRQVDWLYMHEAIPGHHFQFSIAQNVPRTAVHRLLFYLGYSEGWAAYIEELGKELGMYQSWGTELGKWEWDIVRSMRLVIDVGINYLGWSDEKALEYWQSNWRGADNIAQREIARVKRWPAQVVTYKYGASKILKWKETAKGFLKEKFNEKEFHHQILKDEGVPFSVLESLIFK